MLRIAWVGVKLALSALLLGLAWFALANDPTAIRNPQSLGISALFLFLAALPWVDFSRPNRALGLVATVIALAFLVVAASYVTDTSSLPRTCSGRSAWFCEFTNWLHGIGGPYLAALPVAALAGFILVGGIATIVRARHAKPDNGA